MARGDAIVRVIICYGTASIGVGMGTCYDCEDSYPITEATDEWLRNYDLDCIDRDNYAHEELRRRAAVTSQ